MNNLFFIVMNFISKWTSVCSSNRFFLLIPVIGTMKLVVMLTSKISDTTTTRSLRSAILGIGGNDKLDEYSFQFKQSVLDGLYISIVLVVHGCLIGSFVFAPGALDAMTFTAYGFILWMTWVMCATVAAGSLYMVLLWIMCTVYRYNSVLMAVRKVFITPSYPDEFKRNIADTMNIKWDN